MWTFNIVKEAINYSLLIGAIFLTIGTIMVVISIVLLILIDWE